METGVTIVTGPGGGGGPGKGPQGPPRGPKKSPRKQAAQEKPVKAKVGAVCLLENKKNESK
jgi:hypothetical protein